MAALIGELTLTRILVCVTLLSVVDILIAR